MNKRKYEREEERDEGAYGDGYEDAECSQCGAIINTKFQRGRHTRRLHCPVCRNLVILTREPKADLPDLIQLQWKSK